MFQKLSVQQFVIVVLTVATAVIHFSLLFPDVLFILNGLGYLSLLAALYFIPQLAAYRKWTRWAFIGYAALTIILYFVMNSGEGFAFGLGLVTKVIEVVLIILLFLDRNE